MTVIHSFDPVRVTIFRGRFLNAAGKPTGSWRYFISYVEADGCECCMQDCASYYQALVDAQELAADANVPIADLTDEAVG
jgi:hypothetical protein